MSNPPPQAPWLVAGATILAGVLLAFHVVYDAVTPSYDGSAITFALIGLFGGLLGIHKSLRSGDGP